MPGNPALIHRQHNLHHAGDPGGRFQVTHVGLDRADQQGIVRVASPAVGLARGVGFDGVAHGRAGPVCLHIVHVRGRQSRIPQRILHYLLLRLLAGHGQPRARTVLVQRRASDHRPDSVTVRLRILQALQHQDAATLAAHVAVGGFIESRATAVGRQHAGAGAHLQQPSGENGVYAARQRQIRLTPLQARNRLVDRHQGGRAGRVQCDRRPGEPQRIGDPPDGRVEGRPRDRIETDRGFGSVIRIQHEPPVFVVADPRVDTGSAVPESLRIDAGVFQSLPARFQHHPLLRVKKLRLYRRDSEERRVELIELVQIRAEAARPALDRGVGKEFAHAADAGTRVALGHGALAGCEQSPEGVQAVGAGEAAGHADDCNRFADVCIPGLRLKCRLAGAISGLAG